MITEERIKKLKEKYGYDVYLYARTLDEYEKIMEQLIRAVAAEAQEEGRKELVEARELLAEIEAIADNSVVVDMCQNYFEQLKKRE